MNRQESVELEYFQKIQVLTQQIKALQHETGVLTSERDELRHELNNRKDSNKYRALKEENKALKQQLKNGKERGWVVISAKREILQKINNYESIISNLLKP